MPYAKVTNGVVTNVASTASDSTWITCGNAVTVGWIFTNNTFTPKHVLPYMIANWYWIVAGSITQVYSSARAEYVSVTDNVYIAWLAQGGVPTPIATEGDLQGLFSQQFPSGWPPTAAQQAGLAAITALGNGLVVSSVSAPAINGTYSTTANSISNVNAIMTYILANNTFPNNASTLAWADTSGTVHEFPNTTVFKNFAIAFANYVTAVNIYGDSGGTIGSIPSNQIAVP
jgi:hypothetical protein